MTIVNSRLRVKDENGDYVVYHPQTNANMVLLPDGTTLSSFIAAQNQRIAQLEQRLAEVTKQS